MLGRQGNANAGANPDLLRGADRAGRRDACDQVLRELTGFLLCDIGQEDRELVATKTADQALLCDRRSEPL